MPEKWKIKRVGNRTYRGKRGKVTPWIVQYKDDKGNWKDTVNISRHQGKIITKFD